MSTVQQQRTRCGAGPTTSAAPRRARRRPRGLVEIALLAGAWVLYSVARGLATGDETVARAHALALWSLERHLHLDVEPGFNALVSGQPWLAVPMSFWYASLHYLVTPAVLAWLFWRRPASYRRARTALVSASAIALVFYVLLPTAPPRLVGTSFVDTLSRYSDVGWWSDHASAPAGLGQLTDQLAAMPSLHVGWTLWVAWALWPHVGRTARGLSVAYTIGTTLVVIGTGNHWLVDALAGYAVIMVGIQLSRIDPLVVARAARRVVRVGVRTVVVAPVSGLSRHCASRH